MSKKKTTIRDVAQAAGVSLATASYVLNGKKSFNQATRERVLQAAKKLEFQPNAPAQAMRTGKTLLIGLVVPTVYLPFFPAFAKAVQHIAHQFNYSVVLINSQENQNTEQQGLLRLRELGVDGIIWCPVNPQQPTDGIAPDTPIVLVDSAHSDPACDLICSNQNSQTSLLLEHLTASHHKQLAYISCPRQLHNTQRLLAQLPPSVQLVWQAQIPSSLQLDQATIALLKSDVADIIIVPNDLIAMAVADQLKLLKSHIPQKISLLSCEASEFSLICSPKLTAIKPNIAQLGEGAMTLLRQRILKPELPPQRSCIELELQLGESCPTAL